MVSTRWLEAPISSPSLGALAAAEAVVPDPEDRRGQDPRSRHRADALPAEITHCSHPVSPPRSKCPKPITESGLPARRSGRTGVAARVAGAGAAAVGDGAVGREEIGDHVQPGRGAAGSAVRVLPAPVRRVRPGRRRHPDRSPAAARDWRARARCRSRSPPSRHRGRRRSRARSRGRRCPASDPARGSACGCGAPIVRASTSDWKLRDLVIAEGDAEQHLVRGGVGQGVVGHPVRVAVRLAAVPEHLDQALEERDGRGRRGRRCSTKGMNSS